MSSTDRSTRAGLERYIAQIEPIRVGVNRLLEGADPILAGFREHRISTGEAAWRMGALERAAIIRWRTDLIVLAQEVHAALPADLRQAGRGDRPLA